MCWESTLPTNLGLAVITIGNDMELNFDELVFLKTVLEDVRTEAVKRLANAEWFDRLDLKRTEKLADNILIKISQVKG